MSKKERTFLGKAGRFLFIKLPLYFFSVTVLWVLVLKWCPVYITPLMISRSIEFFGDDSFHTRKIWKSYKNISPELAKAVIASEDDLFDTHNGFNWKAIKQAYKSNHKGKRLRGGSTISQQTAKNVFCTNNRTWVRKGFETYFTVLIEFFWSKERIMEVYLNVAEMGKGIYGAEAAAKYMFNTSAKKLSRHQSCLIAACLPRPLKRNASKPSTYVSNRASRIAAMERNISYPDWIFHREDNNKKDKSTKKKK